MNQVFTFDLTFETARALFGPDYDYNSHVIEYRVWKRNMAAKAGIEAVEALVNSWRKK